MSAIDGFDGMPLAGGVGALDAGRLPLEAAAAGARAPQSGPSKRARAPVHGEEDVMVGALRKESVDPNARASAMHSEATPPQSGGAEESLASESSIPENGPSTPPPDAPVGWAGILIQVLAIAIVAAGITLVALKMSGLLSPPQVRVVTFDVLKYENAERAQAMKLMGQGGAGAVAPMLSFVSKRLTAAIEKAAGPGTLVVLSQAVVQGQTRDITDQVLKELGLPTKAPTATAVKSLSIAPGTMVPPVSASQSSPLSRLLNSGSHTKNHSIVP